MPTNRSTMRLGGTLVLAATGVGAAAAGCTVRGLICYEDMPDHRILPSQVANGAMTHRRS